MQLPDTVRRFYMSNQPGFIAREDFDISFQRERAQET
jgi:hypothetical protein